MIARAAQAKIDARRPRRRHGETAGDIRLGLSDQPVYGVQLASLRAVAGRFDASRKHKRQTKHNPDDHDAGLARIAATAE